MRAYRCDMCHSVFLLSDDRVIYDDVPMSINYGCKEFDPEEPLHHYDICHDCAQKIERFISDNLEEVRKKVLE